MDQVQHLDIVPPAFEQGAVLVQQAALGQQHHHALVVGVEQVSLHHALGLAAARAGDDQHVIVDLGNFRVHAVRPFRAVTKDQGIIFLLPRRFFLYFGGILLHQSGLAFFQHAYQPCNLVPIGTAAVTFRHISIPPLPICRT